MNLNFHCLCHIWLWSRLWKRVGFVIHNCIAGTDCLKCDIGHRQIILRNILQVRLLRRRRSIRRVLSRIGWSFWDLGLRHLADNYQVSSVKSGSGQPPDRAQMCSFVCWSRLILFFSEPVSGPPNGILSDETRKRTSEKVILSEYVHRTAPNLGQDQITVWLKQHFANELLWWPA